MPPKTIAIDDTILGTWFERDRAHVCLSHRDDSGEAGQPIIEWWDGAVSEAVQDGFLNPKDYHASAFAYAAQLGLLAANSSPLTIRETPTGYVVASESMGIYLGWRHDGTPIWSSQATEAELAAGAWSFVDAEEPRQMFENDRDRASANIEFTAVEEIDDSLVDKLYPDDLDFVEVELDVTCSGMAAPSRSSIDACLSAGIELPATAQNGPNP